MEPTCTCNPCHAETCRCASGAAETKNDGCCCGDACGCGTCTCPPACGC